MTQPLLKWKRIRAGEYASLCGRYHVLRNEEAEYPWLRWVPFHGDNWINYPRKLLETAKRECEKHFAQRDLFQCVRLRAGEVKDGWLLRLEIGRNHDNGNHRYGYLPDEMAGLIDAPIGVTLDWLEEFAERVAGLNPAEIREAVAVVRRGGHWFCK